MPPSFGFLLFFIMLQAAGVSASVLDTNETLRRHTKADSVLSTLDAQKIYGQRLLFKAERTPDRKWMQEAEKLLQSGEVGGLYFENQPAESLVTFLDRINHTPYAVKPWLVAGPGVLFSLTGVTAGAVGQLSELSFVTELGHLAGLKLRQMGFNACADVFVSAVPSLLGTGFTESSARNIELTASFLLGLQKANIAVWVAPFPDYALGTNEIPEPDESPAAELLRSLIKQQLISGLELNDLSVPGVEKRKNTPFCFSEKAIKTYVKGKLKWKGLTVAGKYIGTGKEKSDETDNALQALEAGCDLVHTVNPHAVFAKKQKKDDSEEYALNVLKAKEAAGFFDSLPGPAYHSEIWEAVKEEMAEKMIVVLSNEDEVLPLRALDSLRGCLLTLGTPIPEFAEYLNLYAQMGPEAEVEKTDNISAFVKDKNLVILGVFAPPGSDDDIENRLKKLIEKLTLPGRKLVVCLFGDRAVLQACEDAGVLVYQPLVNAMGGKAVPQLLFGGYENEGLLSFKAFGFAAGAGKYIPALGRLRYVVPYRAGVSKEKLAGIDTVMELAIKRKATPGAQVQASLNGKVFFRKNYGNMVYSAREPVTNKTIYDIASVTKVTATLQAVMFLYEKGLLNLDTTLEYYLPELSGTDKAKLVVREVLLHQAGLFPYIQHWKYSVEQGVFKSHFYAALPDVNFPFQVSAALYASKALQDTMWYKTLESRLIDPRTDDSTCYPYRYSDLGFYFMKAICERLLNQTVDSFMNDNWYTPLGMHHTMFNPLRQYPVEHIAPTEQDDLFRKSIIRGTVHDEGAAMLGGVAGHAGLFSTANDLNILFQMHLQNGMYGGDYYFRDSSTISYFARRSQIFNRRGLGWDKAEMGDKGGPTSPLASNDTYGHSGFTGTCAWTDPQAGLIFIFLSNRTYPTASNNTLVRTGVRTDIHDILYKSFLKPRKK